jgi:MFS transporter, DHA1 family, multidrug resistance protein
LLVSGLTTGIAAFATGFLVFMACHPVLYVLTRRGIGMLPRRQMGRAFGAFGLASDIGFVVGPLLGMLLYSHFDQRMFVLLAVLSTVAGIAALTMRGLPSRLLVSGGRQPEPSRRRG